MLSFIKRLRTFIHWVRAQYLFMELFMGRWKIKLRSLYKVLLAFRLGKIEVLRTAIFIIQHELRAFGLDKAARLTRVRATRAHYARFFAWKHLDAETFLKQLKRLYFQARKLSKYTGFLQIYSFFLDAGYFKNLSFSTTLRKRNIRLATLATIRFSLLDRLVWPIFIYMSEIFETYLICLQLGGFIAAFVGMTILSWFPYISIFFEKLFFMLLNIYGIYYWQRISLYMILKTYVLGLLVYQVYLLADALLYFKAAWRSQRANDPILFFDALHTVKHTSVFGEAFFGKARDAAAKELPLPQLSVAFWEVANAYMWLTCVGIIFSLCVNPLGFAIVGAYFTIIREVVVRSNYLEPIGRPPKELADMKIAGFISWLSKRYPKQAAKHARGHVPLFGLSTFSEIFENFAKAVWRGLRLSVVPLKMGFTLLSVFSNIIGTAAKYINSLLWWDYLRATIFPRFRPNYEKNLLLEEIADIIDSRTRLRKLGRTVREGGAASFLLLPLIQQAALLMDPIYGENTFADYDSYLPTEVSMSLAQELVGLEARVYQKLVILGMLDEGFVNYLDNVNEDLPTLEEPVLASDEELDEEALRISEKMVEIIRGDLSGTVIEALRDVPPARVVFSAWGGRDEEGSIIMARQRVSERGLLQVTDEENTRLINWLYNGRLSAENANWIATNGFDGSTHVCPPSDEALDSFILSSFERGKSTEDLLTHVIPLFPEHPFIQYLIRSGARKPEISLLDIVFGINNEDEYFNLFEELENYMKTENSFGFTYEEFIRYCDSPRDRLHNVYTDLFTEFLSSVVATFACLVLFFANEHWFYLNSLSAVNTDLLLDSLAYKNLALLCDALLYDFGDSGLLDEYSSLYDTCYSLYTLCEGSVFPMINANPDPALLSEFPPYPELKHIPIADSIGGDAMAENFQSMLDVINPKGFSGADEVAIYTHLQGLSVSELVAFDELFDKSRGKPPFEGDFAYYVEARKEYKKIKMYENWLQRRRVFSAFWQNPFAVHRWPETLKTAWLDLRKPRLHPESELRAADIERAQHLAMERKARAVERLKEKWTFGAKTKVSSYYVNQMAAQRPLVIQNPLENAGRHLRYLFPGLRYWFFEKQYPLLDYAPSYTQPVRTALTEITHRMLYIRKLQAFYHDLVVLDPLYVWPLVSLDRYWEYTDYTDYLPEEYLDVALTQLLPESMAAPIFFSEKTEEFSPVSTFAELLVTPEYTKLDDMWDWYRFDFFFTDEEELDWSDDQEAVTDYINEEYIQDQLEQEVDIDLLETKGRWSEIASRLPVDEGIPVLGHDIVLEPLWLEAPHDAWLEWMDGFDVMSATYLDEVGFRAFNYDEEDHPLGSTTEIADDNMFFTEVRLNPMSLLETVPQEVQQIEMQAAEEGKEISESNIFYEYLDIQPQSQMTIYDEYTTWQHLKQSWLKIKLFAYRTYFEDVVELVRGADDFFEEVDYDFWNAQEEVEKMEGMDYLFTQAFVRLKHLIYLFLYNYHTLTMWYIDPYMSGDLWSNEVQQNVAEFLE